VLTGISGTGDQDSQGDIKFQVVMDSGSVKEITTQACWIPDMKYQYSLLSHFLTITRETTKVTTIFWMKEVLHASSLEKGWTTS